jgi:hypothetical protein
MEQVGRSEKAKILVSSLVIIPVGVFMWRSASAFDIEGRGLSGLVSRFVVATDGWFARVFGITIICLGAVLLALCAHIRYFRPGRIRLGEVAGAYATVIAPPRTPVVLALMMVAILLGWAVASAVVFEIYDGTFWAQVCVLAGLALLIVTIVEVRRSNFSVPNSARLTRVGISVNRGRSSPFAEWSSVGDVIARPYDLEAVLVRGSQDVGIGVARMALNPDQMARLIEYYRDHPEARAELGHEASLETIRRFQNPGDTAQLC